MSFSRHIRTEDALLPEDPRVTSLRQLVCAVGNKVLEVAKLRAELSQTRAAVRTAGRR
jgi:hypothetical protein